jgi:hypothetical protein
MAKAKDPLDEIAGELVVFQHEDQNRADRYFSNDPRWNDSRIRERWIELYSDEAQGLDEDVDEDEDLDDDDDGLPYEQWKNEDLRAELVTRNLSVEGTKAEMAARLRKDDEKQD